jgi:Rieske 2Fe-2S family protein
VQANWKLIFQKYSERYHGSTGQPLTQTSSAPSGGNDLSKGAFLGGYRSLDWRYQPKAHTTDRFLRRTSRPLLAGVRGEDRFRVHYYSLFPTMLLSLHPDYAIAQRLYPQSENRTRVVCEWLFDGTTATDPPAGVDAIEQGDLINRQDWYVCERMQQELSLHPFSAHRHSEPTAFNQEYLRVLGKHTS